MAPPTAYMFFCSENRETARQNLAAAGHEKPAVTLVAKELGQMWKALSDEEKAAYKTRAGEQQQQQQQQEAAEGELKAQQGSPTGEQPQPAGGTGDAKVAALPATWVRRVVGLDPEIQRCSADALLALSTAADVFLGAVCAKATAVAAGAKRQTVRLDDVERCVRSDKRLVAVGMTAVMSMVAAAAEEGAKAAQQGNKKPRIEKAAPAGMNNSIKRAFGLAQ